MGGWRGIVVRRFGSVYYSFAHGGYLDIPRWVLRAPGFGRGGLAIERAMGMADDRGAVSGGGFFAVLWRHLNDGYRVLQLGRIATRRFSQDTTGIGGGGGGGEGGGGGGGGRLLAGLRAVSMQVLAGFRPPTPRAPLPSRGHHDRVFFMSFAFASCWPRRGLILRNGYLLKAFWDVLSASWEILAALSRREVTCCGSCISTFLSEAKVGRGYAINFCAGIAGKTFMVAVD